MENSKLLNILNPVLGFIDSGKFFRQPFKWLYIIIGVLNIIIPIAMIIGVSNGWDYMQGAMRFAMVLNILVAILVAFLGFLIWYKRAQNLKCDAGESSRFIAIPLVANLLQTYGEWIGMIIGVGGFFTALIGFIFGGSILYYYHINFLVVILMPVVGYVLVVFFRFLAEGCLALANIANSAQSIDRKLDKNYETVVETIEPEVD